MPANFANIPASVLASWPPRNTVDPFHSEWLVPVLYILQILTFILVGTRLVLRFLNQAGPWGIDDLVMIPALLLSILATVSAILAVEDYGLGMHTWDVAPSNFEPLALIAWITELSFLISTVCTKVSILLFFSRLTKGSFTKAWKYAISAAVIFTVLYGLAFLFLLIFNCQPTAAYWKSWSFTYTEEYYCADTRPNNVINGVLSVVSDLYAVVLPVVMLRQFDAPQSQKVALNVVFSLGLLVVVFGCIRTYYFWAIAYKDDVHWYGYLLYFWAEMEMQFSMICACAPALRVFVRRFVGDPMSRAIETVRSGRSAAHNTTRPDSENMITRPSLHTRDSSGAFEDKGGLTMTRIQSNVVDDNEAQNGAYSPTSHAVQRVRYTGKLPEDYGHYLADDADRISPISPAHRPQATSIFNWRQQQQQQPQPQVPQMPQTGQQHSYPQQPQNIYTGTTSYYPPGSAVSQYPQYSYAQADQMHQEQPHQPVSAFREPPDNHFWATPGAYSTQNTQQRENVSAFAPRPSERHQGSDGYLRPGRPVSMHSIHSTLSGPFQDAPYQP